MIPSRIFFPVVALLLSFSLFAQKEAISLILPPYVESEAASSTTDRLFARSIPLDLNQVAIGAWVRNNGINGRWEADFTGNGASGLALFLDQVDLPAGGQVWIENSKGKRKAFSDIEKSIEERIFTGFLPGPAVTLVYEGPSFSGEVLPFHIWRADFVNRPEFFAPQKSIVGFGASNDCELNANCSQGDGWANEKSGTARIILVVAEGSGYCSGNLVNNTAEDGRPLFLTGFHCMDGFTPLYDLWRFDFGYRAAGCTDPVMEPGFMAYTGAIERAGRQESDFLLLEIADPAFDADNHYFAGWDRSDGNVNGNLIEFHHPMGDIQKVSRHDGSGMTIFNGPINWNSGVVTPAAHHFTVQYTAGTFEVGSSGSAMFDANRRIRGQLNGGNPSCPGSTQGFIGRLFQSWTGGGTATTRLSDWLDPLGLEPMTLDGATLAGNTGGRILRGIALWKDQPIEGVRLIFNWSNQTDTVYTDANGQYSLPRPDGAMNLSLATNYEDGDELIGVNVVDIIAIRRHILALDTLSQIELLAADVNNTGTESIGDIVQISQVILGLSNWEERPNWIVYPSALSIDPVPTNAFGPFNLTLNNPDAGVITLDIAVVKNGDADFNVYD